MNMGVRIIDVLAGAYRSIEENWCTWLKVILAPIILVVLCQVGAGFAEGMEYEFPILVGASLFSFLFSTILAVNIYRYGILSEHKKGWFTIRLDLPVWRVLLYTLFLYVIVIVAGGIVGAVHLIFDHLGLTAGSGAIVGLITLYFLLRLALLLPAAAVGLKQPLRSTFKMTHGNVIFIFMALFTLMTTFICVFLVTGIPFGLAAAVLSVTFLVHEGIGMGLMAGIGFLYLATCYLYIVAVSGKTLCNIYLDCKTNQ